MPPRVPCSLQHSPVIRRLSFFFPQEEKAAKSEMKAQQQREKEEEDSECSDNEVEGKRERKSKGKKARCGDATHGTGMRHRTLQC